MSRKLLTSDVAEILGVTPSRVGQLVADGALRAELAGDRSPIHLFDRRAVEALCGTRESTRIDRAHRRLLR